jgi:hypothetical protein
MGVSAQHASSVHLVRNLQTGSITPQYHLIFDDFFETVFSDGEQEPDVWPDLVVFQSFANDFDDEGYRPELADEWLNPAELQERVTRQQVERDRLVRDTTITSQRPPTAQRDPKQEHSSSTTSVRVNDHAPPPSQATQFEIKQEPMMSVIDLSNDDYRHATPAIDVPATERRYPSQTRKPTK